ncbi:4'-phosphopantetheinyl transferase superfamily protein [Yoonia sp. F2084L]|nr:4'-phosphopantetheinyl transferase superfamily protein [Yoonia sp. F2084L]
MDGVRAALQRMLGPDVGVGVVDPREGEGDLWPNEAEIIARAVPKRRAEFAAGRQAAREAMQVQGVKPTAILQGADRAPLWPKRMVGSIAHCDTCAIAAVAWDGDHQTLGIDVEPATPLASDLIDILCTGHERDWLHTQSEPGLAAKMIFSAKEAVYKAQYPLTHRVIGFDAVTLTLASDRFEVRTDLNIPKLKGAILIQEGLILSVAHV